MITKLRICRIMFRDASLSLERSAKFLRWNEHMPSDSSNADTCLIVYGTLAPGRVNHHQLAGLRGMWQQGTVRGWLNPAGWAAEVGYPGLILDAAAPLVEVHVFESPDLPHHWSRLDAFEGGNYQRVITRVSTANGEREGWIYVIAREECARRR